MIVHGREVKFLRTVWAISEISKVCPSQNINKLSTALNTGSTLELNDIWMTFMIALNTGYEMAQKYADKDYVSNPLTKDELMALTEDEFNNLLAEATEAWIGDKITVEVEEPKKKEG